MYIRNFIKDLNTNDIPIDVDLSKSKAIDVSIDVFRSSIFEAIHRCLYNNSVVYLRRGTYPIILSIKRIRKHNNLYFKSKEFLGEYDNLMTNNSTYVMQLEFVKKKCSIYKYIENSCIDEMLRKTANSGFSGFNRNTEYVSDIINSELLKRGKRLNTKQMINSISYIYNMFFKMTSAINISISPGLKSSINSIVKFLDIDIRFEGKRIRNKRSGYNLIKYLELNNKINHDGYYYMAVSNSIFESNYYNNELMLNPKGYYRIYKYLDLLMMVNANIHIFKVRKIEARDLTLKINGNEARSAKYIYRRTYNRLTTIDNA